MSLLRYDTGIPHGRALSAVTALRIVTVVAPAARSNSSTPGRVKIPHRCDGVMDDYASA